MIPIVLSCTVDSYKNEGLIALPFEASRCSVLATGPNDEDIFQSVVLKTGYDFSKVTRVFVDSKSTQVLTCGTEIVNIVPVVLTPSHNEKTRLIFQYVYTVKCPLLRWVLTNSHGQVVTIMPVETLSSDGGPQYSMLAFKCGPDEAQIYANAIVAAINAPQAKEAPSVPPLDSSDLETFCKNLNTEQWGRFLSWGSECEHITSLCHQTSVVLVDQASQAARIGFGLGSTLNGFPLLHAMRFKSGQAGCSFELDTPGLECPWSALRRVIPDWGGKDRPSLPVEHWASFFDPLPSTWAKYEHALASLLEQRLMALMQKLREAVALKHEPDAPQEPSVRCVGKRARRTARRSREGKKAAAVPEKQERRMQNVTVQLSEPAEVDADTDFEDLGDASQIVGSCVEDSIHPCGWAMGSAKDSSCSDTPTSDASTEELDSPLDGHKSMVGSDISSEEFEPSAESQSTWLGTSFWISGGSPKEIVAACELKFGAQWYVTCTAVKNTFLEPVDFWEQEAKAMLRRTRSCSALSLLCV